MATPPPADLRIMNAVSSAVFALAAILVSLAAVPVALTGATAPAPV